MFIERRALAWLALAFALALLLQSVELYQFTDFEFDKVNHVAATRSWLQGRGLSIPDTAPRGLPQAVYRPLLGFPPGYAFALAPVQLATGDVWWSTFAVDVGAQALFLAAWTIVLLAAGHSPRFTAGVILLWTILYGPSTTRTYSDLLALALFAAALAAPILMSGRRHAMAAGLVSGLLTGAACVVRYAYWPLAAVVPLAAIVAWRDRAAIGLAASHAALAGAAVAATAWFMQRTTGEALFLSRWYPAAERGVFWSQLKTLYPFPALAFGLDRIADRLRSLWPDLASHVWRLEWIFSLAVLAVLLPVLVPRVQALLKRSPAPAAAFVDTANLATCAATLAMLVWLTIRLPAMSNGWTVGTEARYFFPMTPALSLWVMSAAARARSSRTFVSLAAAAIVALALAVTLPFRMVREYRYVTGNVHTAWMSAERRRDAAALASAIQAVGARRAPAVIVDDDPKWRRYSATMSDALVVPRTSLPACEGAPVENARFLAVVPHRNAADWQALLQHRSTRQIAVVDEADVIVVDGPMCLERGV